MLIRRRDPAQETVVPVVVMRRWRGAAVGLLALSALLAVLAVWSRAEWLQAARERNDQIDLTYAAEISADYWFRKYYVRERSRPGASERDVHREMAARHLELKQRAEKLEAERRIVLTP